MGIVSDLLKKEEPVKQPPTLEDIAAVLKTEFGIEVSEAKKRYNQKQRQAEDRKRRYEAFKADQERTKKLISDTTTKWLKEGLLHVFIRDDRITNLDDLKCFHCGSPSESMLGYVQSYVENTMEKQGQIVFGRLYIPLMREVVICPHCHEPTLIFAHTVFQGEKGVE